jgi:hypothetical protein
VASLGQHPDSQKFFAQRARCTGCGCKGTTIQHPSWGGETIGFLPFPVDAKTG